MILWVFNITFLSLGTMFTTEVFGWCPENEDWPDAPCYGCPACYPGIDQEKLHWMPYYDFKGSEWMESKKQEMIHAIENDTLEDWIEQNQDTQANHNVERYYFLLEQHVESESNLGGGSIDLDPDLSPSFAMDYQRIGLNSIFVFVPLISGIIAIVLLTIHFILKKKNIRSRPYITIIAAAIMLYFGIQTLSVLGNVMMFLQQESLWHYREQILLLLFYPIFGFTLIGFGIVFLYKSKLIRQLSEKIKKK